MTKEAIYNALIRVPNDEFEKIAEAIANAYDSLKEVRTGDDFEVECWRTANELERSLGLNDWN